MAVTFSPNNMMDGSVVVTYRLVDPNLNFVFGGNYTCSASNSLGIGGTHSASYRTV